MKVDDAMPTGRPYYDRAFAALEAAHKACFDHPERDILGMSHGPFSGVNEALGIVAELEDENERLRAALKG
jgi:hypothetical protein